MGSRNCLQRHSGKGLSSGFRETQGQIPTVPHISYETLDNVTYLLEKYFCPCKMKIFTPTLLDYKLTIRYAQYMVPEELE